VELAGGALGLLLILRTNAGYDRWWEGRKLWGAIVNQSRNLAISTLEYAHADGAWRERFLRWTAAFAHAARHSLRGETDIDDVASLVGEDDARRLRESAHMPSAVAAELAAMLNDAVDEGRLSPVAFLQCDRERALLVDHVGGCERILKTPLPAVYVIKLRRFVAIYLLVLPFALMEKVGWSTPFLTMLVAYPVLGLDQIGAELENPFSTRNLSHLPLEAICDTIEKNVLGLLSSPERTWSPRSATGSMESTRCDA
jgi:putative membrane protein